MASEAQRYHILPQAGWADATIVLALGVLIGISKISKLGDSVWQLAEEATATVGASLALRCILIPLRRQDRVAAGLGAVLAQAV